MTNLLTNGSFEGGTVATTIVPVNWGHFTDQLASASADTYSASSTNFIGNDPVDPDPTDGALYSGFGSTSTYSEGLTQSLSGGALTAGQSYTFSADVYGDHNAGTGSYSLIVADDGVILTTIPITVDMNWETVSATFVAPAGIDEIDIYLTLMSGSNVSYIGIDNASLTAVCFVSGSLIKIKSGEVPIETLSAGDMALTMDNGYQPIRWIGSSRVAATGDLAPILIRKGALGNDRDLRVSPQHRMLLQGWQAELLFGETEVLATAKSLVNDHSIIRVEGGEVEYFHMLFDTHEIVWAEGAPSESFHPGEQGWKALDKATRDEILELFPQLAEDGFETYGPSARLSLKHKEGQVLGRYMTEGTPQNA